MKKLYIFDFDGTITKRDSFILFTLFSVSFFSFIKYWIKTLVCFFFCKKSKLKEDFFLFHKGINIFVFNQMCLDFFEKKMKKYIKESFLKYVNKLDVHSEVVIVSASVNNYLKPWCNEMGFKLISTELNVVDDKLTGKFLSPNCNGFEKVKRIKECYDLTLYTEIHVFGNSKGDLPMLKIGSHKYYNFFN